MILLTSDPLKFVHSLSTTLEMQFHFTLQSGNLKKVSPKKTCKFNFLKMLASSLFF